MWNLSMSKYNDNFNNKKENKVIADSFIDSIQEEINKENWKRIWEKYGKIISIGVSCLIIVSIGYNVWQKQDLEDREAISASFTNSQNDLAADRTKSALTGFKEIGKSAHILTAKIKLITLTVSAKTKIFKSRRWCKICTSLPICT